MSLGTFLIAAPAGAQATPSLALFLVAAVSGFVVLILTLWLGRSVESGGGKMLLFLTGLALATGLVLLILFVGPRLDIVSKVG